jgi:hypothetical protein
VTSDASTNLEARLGNPSLTHFQAKQATRSRRVSHAIFILPSILWHNRQTIAYLVLRPKPRNYCDDFVGQITKLQLPVLRLIPRNPSEQFWGQTTRTVATSFEAKLRETVDLGFWAEPRNTCSSSPYAWCRPHTMSPDLSIIRQPHTQPVLDHPRSSAPSLLLLSRSSSLPTMPHLSPTHHETRKRVSPHETDSRVEPPKFPGFKFKPSQLLITNQTKILNIWFLNVACLSLVVTLFYNQVLLLTCQGHTFMWSTTATRIHPAVHTSEQSPDHFFFIYTLFALFIPFTLDKQ